MNPTLKIVDELQALLANASSPAQANQILGGVLANTIGHIPAENWDAMVEDAKVPCGEFLCQCHIVRVKMFEALSLLRKDWRTVFNKDGGKN